MEKRETFTVPLTREEENFLNKKVLFIEGSRKYLRVIHKDCIILNDDEKLLDGIVSKIKSKYIKEIERILSKKEVTSNIFTTASKYSGNQHIYAGRLSFWIEYTYREQHA